MDKVITEWRVVETEDGFRIEIKGDKQQIREWIKHFRAHGPMYRMPWDMMAGCGAHARWQHREPDEEPSTKD